MGGGGVNQHSTKKHDVIKKNGVFFFICQSKDQTYVIMKIHFEKYNKNI